MLTMGSDDPWPPRPGRSRLLQPVIQIGAASIMIVGGVRTAALGSAALGIILLAAGGITAALAVRGLIHRLRSPEGDFESSGELPKDQFDYLVWTALGLPIVLALTMLVFVLTGSR
jgi:hypothetical protein